MNYRIFYGGNWDELGRCIFFEIGGKIYRVIFEVKKLVKILTFRCSTNG
jgi:hypothetical protein